MKTTTTTSKRAPGQTQISISLPTDLVKRLDLLAGDENRNRSNYIVSKLKGLRRTKAA